MVKLYHLYDAINKMTENKQIKTCAKASLLFSFKTIKQISIASWTSQSRNSPSKSNKASNQPLTRCACQLPKYLIGFGHCEVSAFKPSQLAPQRPDVQ